MTCEMGEGRDIAGSDQEVVRIRLGDPAVDQGSYATKQRRHRRADGGAYCVGSESSWTAVSRSSGFRSPGVRVGAHGSGARYWC